MGAQLRVHNIAYAKIHGGGVGFCTGLADPVGAFCLVQWLMMGDVILVVFVASVCSF